MSKLIRSMLKEKGLSSDNKPREKCQKCRKAPAGLDGLCDSCRYDALLVQIIEKRESS